MKITKAIIPVAGWGTRRLPITKTIEKCMLPIGNRPLVDYTVSDCIKAGITEIIFVVSENSTQLQDYYGENLALNEYLSSKNKQQELKTVSPPEGIEFKYLIQKTNEKYGTAVPVGMAADLIEDNESALVLMGDDFIWNPNEASEMANLIKNSSKDGAAILGAKAPSGDLSRYGILKFDENKIFQSIVEKPKTEEAPSNLMNVSKYLLPKRVFEIARDIKPNPVRGEYEITDAINQFIDEGGIMTVYESNGEFLDGGTVEGWLHANNTVLKD